MIGVMVVAGTRFAFGVLGRDGVFHFTRGPGDDGKLVVDLGSSCGRTGGQSGMVRLHVYILDESKSKTYPKDGGKSLHDPKA